MSGILERLHKWRWQRRVKKTLTGKVYKMAEHQGWGHRISVHGDLTMDGHGMGLKVGDEIRVPLRTGETARTARAKVRECSHPKNYNVCPKCDLLTAINHLYQLAMKVDTRKAFDLAMNIQDRANEMIMSAAGRPQ